MTVISNQVRYVYPESFEAGSDADNVQAAIDYMGNTGGGEVKLLRRIYEFDKSVVLRKGVTLVGQNWTPSPEFLGSTIHLTNPNVSAIIINDQGYAGLRANKCAVRDIGFSQVQPDPNGSTFTPYPTPPTILVDTVDDVELSNLFFHNVTFAIRGYRAGRLYMRRILGQPLTTGIELDDIFDVAKITDIHFWVFWSSSQAVYDHMRQNATTIKLLRCDNPQLSNVFSFGYRHGLFIIDGVNGPTSRLQGTNLQFDATTYGVLIIGTGHTAQISNLVCHCADVTASSAPGSIPVYIIGDQNVLNVSNGRYEYGDTHGLRVEGNSLMVDVGGIGIDTSTSGFVSLVGGGQLQQYAFNFT